MASPRQHDVSGKLAAGCTGYNNGNEGSGGRRMDDEGVVGGGNSGSRRSGSGTHRCGGTQQLKRKARVVGPYGALLLMATLAQRSMAAGAFKGNRGANNSLPRSPTSSRRSGHEADGRQEPPAPLARRAGETLSPAMYTRASRSAPEEAGRGPPSSTPEAAVSAAAGGRLDRRAGEGGAASWHSSDSRSGYIGGGGAAGGGAGGGARPNYDRSSIRNNNGDSIAESLLERRRKSEVGGGGVGDGGGGDSRGAPGRTMTGVAAAGAGMDRAGAYRREAFFAGESATSKRRAALASRAGAGGGVGNGQAGDSRASFDQQQQGQGFPLPEPWDANTGSNTDNKKDFDYVLDQERSPHRQEAAPGAGLSPDGVPGTSPQTFQNNYQRAKITGQAVGATQPASSTLFRRAGSGGVFFIFLILVCRSLNHYEYADQMMGVVRAISLFPAVSLFLGNLVCMCLSLVQSATTRQKARMKTMLTMDAVGEALLLLYNMLLLLGGTSGAIPKEEFVSRMLTNVLFMSLCFTFAKARWVADGAF